jgi:CRP/FNR family cyclic AMP-dependent transcriptional regulator
VSTLNFDFASQPAVSSVALKVLRDSALFGGLDDTELEAVARTVVDVAVPAGGVVIHEGAPGENLYLVRSGRLKVEKDADGRRLLLGELGPGSAFGEMSLIHSVPTSATVTAVDESRLLAIGRLDLDVLLNWNPILASKMWRSFTQLLATRLRDMNERMVDRFGA